VLPGRPKSRAPELISRLRLVAAVVPDLEE